MIKTKDYEHVKSITMAEALDDKGNQAGAITINGKIYIFPNTAIQDMIDGCKELQIHMAVKSVKLT